MPYSKAGKLEFRRAAKLRAKGDMDGAIQVLRQLISEFPDQAAASLVIGDILWSQGKMSQAAKEFRRTTKRFPQLEIASLGLFHTLWAQSKTDAAFDEMKRFQSISFCKDYKRIVNEILQKTPDTIRKNGASRAKLCEVRATP